MSEKNLLKAIKAAGKTHAEILEFLNKEGILGGDDDLMEEERAALQKEKLEKEKAAKKKAEEEESEEEEEEEEPSESDDKLVLKEIAKLRKEIKDIKIKGIPLKTPSKGKKTGEEDLPEGTIPKIEKNKFEMLV